MNLSKIIPVAIALFATSCGAQNSKGAETIDFGSILRPHYESTLSGLQCEGPQDVEISVFDQKDQTLSFQYGQCNSETKGEMVDFSFKSKFILLEDYIFGKYRIPTPERALKLNPNAEKYTYLDTPIIGVTKLGEMSVDEYLKSKKTFHKVDWRICKLRKFGDHIWGLENPAYKEVPPANYTFDKYASSKDWELNHDADEANFKQKYGAQQRKNRACANEQHYWYVAKDGILITLSNPTNFIGGANPLSIVYSSSR